MAINHGREKIEMLVRLIKTATTERQISLLAPEVVDFYEKNEMDLISNFKQRMQAKPKKTLLNLAEILSMFLSDTEQLHYLTDELNIPPSEAAEVVAKVARTSKRRI